MRTISLKRVGWLLAGMAVLASCNKEEDADANSMVVFSAGIEATRTTSGGDAWVLGDAVGIYMLSTGGTLPGAISSGADNKKHTVTDASTGALSPDGGPALYFPQSGNVDFIAYYPYGAYGAGAGEINTSGYRYKVSAANQTAPEAIDVLYAKTTNVSKSVSAVALPFKHALSKITLNVKAGDGITAAAISSLASTGVKFGGMPVTADLALQTGALTAGTDLTQTFSPLKSATATAGYAASFTAILIPQAASAYPGRTVVFDLSGTNYTWTIPDTDAFATGLHYTYAITIKKTGIMVTTPTVIEDWQGTGATPGSGTTEELGKGIAKVIIPAGTFLMGSSDGSNIGDTDGTGLNTTPAEPDRNSNETQHQVTLTQDFYMSKYPITNAQYAQFLNAIKAGSDGKFSSADYPGGQYSGTGLVLDCSTGNRSAWGVKWVTNQWVPIDDAHKNHPVIYVTWYGAMEYAHWVGGTLPTEAQWEYACRGDYPNKAAETDTKPFGIGDGTKLTFGMANYYVQFSYQLPGGNFQDDANHSIHYKDATTAVGSYPYANSYGLYDMHGNVYEWCLDQWDGSDNYGSLPATDPLSTSGSSRVLRGGSWRSSAQGCRSALRDSYDPGDAGYGIGFRVVFVP